VKYISTRGYVINADNTPVCVHNSERKREHMSLPNLQAMVFPDGHPELKLRGQAKGIEQILRERGL